MGACCPLAATPKIGNGHFPSTLVPLLPRSVRKGLLPSELAWESFVSLAKDLFDGLHDRDFEIFLLITEPFQFAQVLLEAL